MKINIKNMCIPLSSICYLSYNSILLQNSIIDVIDNKEKQLFYNVKGKIHLINGEIIDLIIGHITIPDNENKHNNLYQKEKEIFEKFKQDIYNIKEKEITIK